MLHVQSLSARLNFFLREKPEYVFLAAAKVGGILANNTYRAQFIYENLQIQNNAIHASYEIGVKKFRFFGSSCLSQRGTSTHKGGLLVNIASGVYQ